MRFAYNTNGLLGHRLNDAVELIAEAGYAGIVLNLSPAHLDPMAAGAEATAEALRGRLEALDLAAAVDSDAPFVLDPAEAGAPSLLASDETARGRRIELIGRAAKIASLAGATAVSFSTGRAGRGLPQKDAGAFLLDGLKRVADVCAAQGVVAALKPGPRQMVATADDFRLVREAVKQTTDAALQLSYSTASGHAAHDGGPVAALKTFAPVLALVTIADGRSADPLPVRFGEGEIDIVGALAALEEVEYDGLVAVELPREVARADEMVPDALGWLLENAPSD